MAPEVNPPTSDQVGAKPGNNDGLSTAKSNLRANLLRKRTKTGCLTCRRRRIKCGEERPICNNCTKSKRHCEGYSQRLTFKPPTFDIRHVANGGAQITFQAAPLSAPVAAYPQNDQEPLLHYVETSPFPPARADHAPNGMHCPVPAFITSAQHGYGYPVAPPPVPNEQFPPGPSQLQQSFIPSTTPFPQPFAAPSASGYAEPTSGYHIPRVATSRPEVLSEHVATYPHHVAPNGYDLGLPSAPHHTQREYWHTNSSTAIPVRERPQSFLALSAPGPEDPNRFNSGTQYVPRPELSHPLDYRPPTAVHSTVPEQHNGIAVALSHAGRAYSYPSPESHDYDAQGPWSDSLNYLLDHAAVERQDDEYYDINSDEEMDVDTTAIVTSDESRQRTLSGIVREHRISITDLQMRQYDTFIHEGILENYNLEEQANPLRNPATARVFLHFIAVTGPTLSIFERNTRNTSLLFTHGAIPFSQQGLWTYTMPMAALHHRGLLHAMLALASLHIARLKNGNTTPSVMHYAWALKRVHHCVGHPKKRLKLTTIAASMLLGFYEIMAADHMKWNMHLAGSKQLFVEIKFDEIMQQFRRMKIERASRHHLGDRRRRSDTQPSFSQDDLLDQIPDVDERMISKLVGHEVRYGDPDHMTTPPSSIRPALNLLELGMIKDLYWWYCKQDAYQSIVSGNPLLMEFSRWGNCPPRAPVGQADAVYGSFDHLMLLLGRVADFSSRDRARKLRQLALNGGSGRPSPSNSNNISGPPPGHAPPTPQSANGAFPATSRSANGGGPPLAGGPAFYGMAPPPRQNVQMPNSFRPLHDYTPSQPVAPAEGPGDFQAETRAALEEYIQIRAALHDFASSLGDSFQPLTSEYQPEVATPFGPALFYRSYDIGCLWAVYNMTVIIAIRSHPDMHPAAHVAAHMAAKDTEKLANDIGRIVAGIAPGLPDQTLNPSLGAALCESCMPSFFAAIQYRDPLQRQSTVARILNIAQRTGWGSADLIASGIETAWVKAAAAGRGPPYTRMRWEPQSNDPRLNGSMIHVDMNSMPDETNEADRRLVRIRPDARLNWAIGVMGTEEDELC